MLGAQQFARLGSKLEEREVLRIPVKYRRSHGLPL